MTIREKLLTIGLNPKQTVDVTLLLTESFVIGAAMSSASISRDIIITNAMRILDHPHLKPPMPLNYEVFSMVFGIDLTNELP
jgi:hypothetical protein